MGSNKGYDLVGKTFERLTVLKDTGKRHPKQGKVWLCRCECTSLTEATTTHLKWGNKKSCGCLAKETVRKNAMKRRAIRKEKKPVFKVSKPKRGQAKQKQISDQTTFVIPDELRDVPYQMVEDGLFQVFENGRIFRHTPRQSSECIVHDSNGYKVVSASVDGTQKHFYVHRLLAQAFVPNPEQKPVVSFKDGNRGNISLDNLIWETHEERAIKMYKTGKIDPRRHLETCKQCGGGTRNKDGICSRCEYENNCKEKRKERISERISRYSDIPIDLCTPSQQRVIRLLRQGLNGEEVAKKLGVSRQAVDSAVKTARRRVQRLTRLEIEKEKRMKSLNNKPDHMSKIKWLRKLNGLTQQDMAELLDITSSSYSQKEREITPFSVSEAILLADFFDKTVESLFS